MEKRKWNKTDEGEREREKWEQLDLFVNGGLRFVNVFLARERSLRNGGNEIELLLHLFERFKNHSGQGAVVRGSFRCANHQSTSGNRTGRFGVRAEEGEGRSRSSSGSEKHGFWFGISTKRGFERKKKKTEENGTERWQCVIVSVWIEMGLWLCGTKRRGWWCGSRWMGWNVEGWNVKVGLGAWRARGLAVLVPSNI